MRKFATKVPKKATGCDQRPEESNRRQSVTKDLKKEQVALRHQTVSGSLALLYLPWFSWGAAALIWDEVL